MKVIKGKKTFEMGRSELEELVEGFAEIVVDIGTGDGKFVYKLAQAHPEWFCIGIDSTQANLEEYSAKIYKKPSRGGLSNAIYVIASAEDLPQELNGLADRIYVNFPWGSLLERVVRGGQTVLSNLVRISAAAAIVEMLINYSLFTDPVPVEVRELPELTLDYIDHKLAPAYAKVGIIVVQREILGKDELKEIPTTWSKKLAYGREPRTLHIRMEIKKTDGGDLL